MKEVTCICGERIVFLDPEVEVKTCPNCEMPVRQYPSSAGEASLERPKPPRRIKARKTFYLAGVIAVVLATLVMVLAVAVSKRGAMKEPEAAIISAREAETRGDFNTAAASYRRALTKYERWGKGPETTEPVAAALARVMAEVARFDAAKARDAEGHTLLSISLEELARQAYDSAPGSFQGVFDRDFAGRVAILLSTVEKGSGSAYKASDLTVSYKAFSSSGSPMELSFDGPFFERYRVKEGSECLIRVILSRAYLDTGGPGEPGHWVLVFDGAKSAPVTDTADLKGLGWKLDDKVENLVASQRRLSPAY